MAESEKTGKKVASKKARVGSKRKARKPRPGDSPINIGGGGGLGKYLGRRVFLEGHLYINLDNNWYTPKPGDEEQQWNKDDEIEMFTVYEGIVGTPHPEADATRNIRIHCLAANDHDSQIKITGKPLGIKFNRRDYEYDSSIGMYVSKVPRSIGRIQVSGKPDIQHLPQCVLVIDNKLNHRLWTQKGARRR